MQIGLSKEVTDGGGLPPGAKIFALSAKEGGNLEAERQVHQSATDLGTNVKALPIAGAVYGKATLNFEGARSRPMAAFREPASKRLAGDPNRASGPYPRGERAHHHRFGRGFHPVFRG